MKVKRMALWAGLAVLSAALTAAVLLYAGVFQLNRPSAEAFPIRGVDVSCYQGEIDWTVLSGQGIRFAYIKATEGSSMMDPRFAGNWTEAAKTDLRIGAYHFFSFETGGQTQAENFIASVSPVENMLPPAVDVEPYGSFTEWDPSVPEQLSAWLRAVEEQYGMKPVIYTTKDFYSGIRAAFPEYELWIRSVYSAPAGEIEWTFWQYSNRTRLEGYAGDEKFVDMNVFGGTEEEFLRYGSGKESGE